MPLVAPWNRKKRAEREKIGHEAPARPPRPAHRSHLRVRREARPPLRRGVDLRELRAALGHEPDPAEQYQAIRRTQLRFRVLPVAYGLLILALAMFFTLTGNIFSVFILLPLGMMIWFYFIRPAHRRRYRRAVAELPRWELRPGLTLLDRAGAAVRRSDAGGIVGVSSRNGTPVRSSTTLRQM